MTVALRAQLYALRAQLDAAILMAEMEDAQSKPQVDPAQTCPTCWATGDSQVDRSTLDGTKRIVCTQCQTERIVS